MKIKSIMITVLIILIAVIASFSYAYTKPNVIEKDKTQTISKSRELDLIFTGEINEESILSGKRFTKTFNVENKNLCNANITIGN